MVSVNFKMFLDRKKITRAVGKKQRAVLSKAGAFTRVAMKRGIRPPKSGKKSRTVMVEGKPMLVPVRGAVLDATTMRPVSKAQAAAARLAMARRYKAEGAGQPPRRGPTDLLRKLIFFGFDSRSESVVIGPMAFKRQPDLVGAKTVPELLEKGGKQKLAGKLVRYAAHPFAAPLESMAANKLAELVKSEPLR